jgi:hypothetical protein
MLCYGKCSVLAAHLFRNPLEYSKKIVIFVSQYVTVARCWWLGLQLAAPRRRLVGASSPPLRTGGRSKGRGYGGYSEYAVDDGSGHRGVEAWNLL